MQLKFSDRFTKALRKLPQDRQNRIKIALKQFIQDPNTPSLRLHKLQNIDAYSISTNRKDRIILEKLPSTAEEQEIWLLLDVGAHKNVYKRLNRR
jgi:mRNA-degrading endonuclease RelE of RelBE toxin-antitoxin system